MTAPALVTGDRPGIQIHVIIPTRNRARLAAAALASLQPQLTPDTWVTMSDNSDDAEQRDWLHEQIKALGSGRVAYITAPSAMSMTDHWSWALDAALAGSPASHITFLTDRMVLKPGWFGGIAELAATYPEDVISYNHDRINDSQQPIRVEAVEWSGRAYRVRSRRLILMGSRTESHPALPRMMNCVVPRQMIDQVQARFGSVFSSISPDHAFAYRCLALTPSIIYYDAAPLIHYALDRSNGASYERGVDSPDRADFARKLQGVRMNHLTPLPEVQTIMNAVVHEYCFVRAELAGNGFPPLDISRYLTAMWVGVDQIEDGGLRRVMRSLVRRRDRLVTVRLLGQRLSRWLAAVFTHPARSAHRILERLAAPWAALASTSSLVRSAIPRRLRTQWPVTPEFSSSDEALQWAMAHARPRNTSATHLMHLLTEEELRNRLLAPSVRSHDAAARIRAGTRPTAATSDSG